MKKSFLIILLILTLGLFVVFLSSCDEECDHKLLVLKTVESSCKSEGYTLNKCSKCSLQIKTDITPKKEHSPTKEVFSPTCTAMGYTTYSCECGETYNSDFVNALGHAFNASTVVPTCTEQGYKTYSCSRCEYKFTADFVSPTGHSLKVSETVLPTCTEEGYKTYSCSKCEYKFTSDIVSPVGHSIELTLTVSPTCTEEGYKHYSCSACDYEYDSDYVEPTGHTFKSVTTPPTSFSPGKREYSCDCGYGFSDNIYPTELYNGAYVEGTEILANGIDISKWNGDINWNEIKEAGIDFVIIRAGYSSTIDPNFEENYVAAKAAGLDVGCYYYSYATSVEEMSEDADELLTWIAGKQFEYPIYLDLEDASQESIDREILFDMCRVFIEKLQANKYFCGLYVSYNWLYNLLNTSMTSTYFDVWIARYWDHTSVWDEEIMKTRTGMWQYTDSGEIGTHTCKFDMNVAFKDYPSIIKEWGLNGFAEPQT